MSSTTTVSTRSSRSFHNLPVCRAGQHLNLLNPRLLLTFFDFYVKNSLLEILSISLSMASHSDSEGSFLEQLISSRNRDLSLLLPFILGFSNSRRGRESSDDEPEPSDQQTTTERQTQDRIILINPFTQGMIVIETSTSLDAILRQISDKDGLPPASKTSIDAMPKVEITEDFECAICLQGWEIGAEAREMPCKHKYHSNCIEKWLGIHGSCPVCRFEMPVDDQDNCKKRNGVGVEERDRSFEREVWVSFSFNRRNSTTSTDFDSTSSNETSTEDSVDVNGASASTNNEE